MRAFIFFLTIFIVGIAYFLFNPAAVRIRKIQSLLNKDRTVCDVINSFDGWSIDSLNSDGLKILIDPVVMPIYALYITYKGRRPTIDDLKDLHYRLTNKDSIVTKAHKMNMPVEKYLDWHKKQRFNQNHN